MSALANVIELPVRHELHERDSLEHDMVLALATADDLASGMDAVVGRIRSDSATARAEWRADDENGSGVFVLHGEGLDPQVESALDSLAPIIRRRAAEERLARTAVQLARRNEALEDFAALVAHELKTPLHAALVSDDPSKSVEDALDLVEALLEAAHNEQGERTLSPVAESLDQAVEDVRAEIEVTADLASTLPLPPGPLHVILRNLLANAVAADARHVHVTAAKSPRSWRLVVEDDGIGLADVESYAAGSGLGLSLCRRIVGRFGGGLELAARPSGGTRATLEFAEARE